MDAAREGANGRLPGGEDPRSGAAAKGPTGAASVTTRNPSTALGVQDGAKARNLRVERYMLQSIARLLIGAAGFKTNLEFPFNFHRTAKCRHTTIGGGDNDVPIYKSIEHGGAFYGGLVVCGSVWACTVCAAKVQERRREEIAVGIDWAYANGLKAVMITLTFPHLVSDDLGDLLDKQAAALKMLREGRTWKRFKAAYGYDGLIRSLEVTIGDHGWHPHCHELWFVDRHADADAMYDDILAMWQSACIRAGLLPAAKIKAFRDHAVDLHDNASTGDYLAKQDDSRHWGADSEMAKGARKKGKHPFQLLIEAEKGDKKAGAKYIEFIVTMRDKRKRQLYWSPGLKERVGLKEKDDETLAEESRDKADQLGRLKYDDWCLVRNSDNRAQLLDIAEKDGWAGILAFLSDLAKKQGVKPLRPGELGLFDRARVRRIDPIDDDVELPF